MSESEDIAAPVHEAEAPPVEVIDPHLNEDQVREVSDQLGEILRGEL